jgi:hypothetical protein
MFAMQARWIRLLLQFGGWFNIVFGFVFFNNQLLAGFLRFALWLENLVFDRTGILPFPQNPVHQMLIHGFGAAAIIIGASLLVSASEPRRYLPFIFIDALGRLLYGAMMVLYVLRYSLPYVILIFATIELSFAILYLLLCWKLAEP